MPFAVVQPRCYDEKRTGILTQAHSLSQKPKVAEQIAFSQ